MQKGAVGGERGVERRTTPAVRVWLRPLTTILPKFKRWKMHGEQQKRQQIVLVNTNCCRRSCRCSANCQVAQGIPRLRKRFAALPQFLYRCIQDHAATTTGANCTCKPVRRTKSSAEVPKIEPKSCEETCRPMSDQRRATTQGRLRPCVDAHGYWHENGHEVTS